MRLTLLLSSMCLLLGDVARAGEPAPPEQTGEDLATISLTFGGMGGPYVAWTRVNGEHSLFVGGRGGVILDHQLVLGLGGGGTVDRIAVPRGGTVDDADYRLELGYGGLWVEYIIAPFKPLHGSFGVLIGGGGVSYTRFRGSGGPEDSEAEDGFFVVEPLVAAEVSLASFMRLDLFAGYRFAAGVDLPKLGDGDVSGPVIGAMLKFGSF